MCDDFDASSDVSGFSDSGSDFSDSVDFDTGFDVEDTTGVEISEDVGDIMDSGDFDVADSADLLDFSFSETPEASIDSEDIIDGVSEGEFYDEASDSYSEISADEDVEVIMDSTDYDGFSESHDFTADDEIPAEYDIVEMMDEAAAETDFETADGVDVISSDDVASDEPEDITEVPEVYEVGDGEIEELHAEPDDIGAIMDEVEDETVVTSEDIEINADSTEPEQIVAETEDIQSDTDANGETPEAETSAYDDLMAYMSSHNYAQYDSPEYTQDPEWQELNNAYRVEQGMEPVDYSQGGDWTDTHVDDFRDELVVWGVPEDSPEFEAMVYNEQQGVDEIVSGTHDVVEPSSDFSHVDDSDVDVIDVTPEAEPDVPAEFTTDELVEVPESYDETEGELAVEAESVEEADTSDSEVTTDIPAEFEPDEMAEFTDLVEETEDEFTDVEADVSAETISDVEIPSDNFTEETLDENTEKVDVTEADETAETDEAVTFVAEDTEGIKTDKDVETTTDTGAEVQDIAPINDVENWISDINPNFDEFDTESPYSNNCGSCAFAVSQRLDGNKDITATADNIAYVSDMEALTGMKQVSMSPIEIEARLLEQGDGAHAIIGIDRADGAGHWFNAACINGKVVAIDGQTGQVSDWPPDYGNVTNWDMSVKEGD